MFSEVSVERKASKPIEIYPVSELVPEKVAKQQGAISSLSQKNQSITIEATNSRNSFL